MAEGEGFEPTLACTKPVFKTGALNRSATLPFYLQGLSFYHGWGLKTSTTDSTTASRQPDSQPEPSKQDP